MLSIMYAEINIFCIIIVALILRKVISGVDTKRRQQMLIHMMVSSILLFTFDLLWVLVDIEAIHVSRDINFLINACYFMSTGVLSYFWFIYAMDIMEAPRINKRPFNIISRLPLVLYVILLVASYWTGWIFYISEDGTYQRGSLYLFQMFVAYGYVLFTTIKSLFLACNKDNWAKRSQYLTLVTFVVFPLIFGIMQILIKGIPLVSSGITLAILCFYLNYQEQQISLDTLTQLNNRRQLVAYLANKVKHLDKDHTLYLLMLDMDYFKKINDHYGHVEGDNALMRVAEVLRNASHNLNCFLSRYGGDEFTVLFEADRPEDIELLCTRIKDSLAIANEKAKTPYQLSLSIGYAAYSKDFDTLQDFFRAADKKLYEVKKARKKA